MITNTIANFPQHFSANIARGVKFTSTRNFMVEKKVCEGTNTICMYYLVNSRTLRKLLMEAHYDKGTFIRVCAFLGGNVYFIMTYFWWMYFLGNGAQYYYCIVNIIPLCN